MADLGPTIYSERIFLRHRDAFSPHLADVGLDGSIFDHPEREVPIAQYIALLECAATAGNPGIGLDMGASLEPGDLGVLGHAAVAARDLHQLLETISRYIYVFAHDNVIRLDVTRERAIVSYQFYSKDGAGSQRDADFAVAAIARLVSLALGAHGVPRSVEFEHQAPDYREAYRKQFGCAVHFAAGGNRLHYDRRLLGVPLRTADRRLFEALEFYLADRLKVRAQDDDVLPKLNHLITTSLHAGPPAIADLASRLGLSSRSLQRKLGALNVTFSELVDRVRRDIALDYVRNSDHRLTDVAMILGYNESSSFTRAFKRWTGVSPEQMRAGASAAG